MLPISKGLSAVGISHKISFKQLRSPVQFIMARRAGRATVQSFVACAEPKSKIPIVGKDNGIPVAVADVIESDPAMLTSS